MLTAFIIVSLFPQLTAMDRVRGSCLKSIGTLGVLDDMWGSRPCSENTQVNGKGTWPYINHQRHENTQGLFGLNKIHNAR